MFTKQHYEAIATLYNHRIKHVCTVPSLDELDKLVIETANAFELDNPQFDRDRFFKAVYDLQ